MEPLKLRGFPRAWARISRADSPGVGPRLRGHEGRLPSPCQANWPRFIRWRRGLRGECILPVSTCPRGPAGCKARSRPACAPRARFPAALDAFFDRGATERCDLSHHRRWYDEEDLDWERVPRGLRHSAGCRHRPRMAPGPDTHRVGAAGPQPATDDGKPACGGCAAQGAPSVELAHHDGCAISLDEPVVRGPEPELGARQVLLR